MGKKKNKSKKDDIDIMEQELSPDLKELLSGELSDVNKKERKRYAEIIAVFAKHNFYAGGLTPVELRTTLEDMGPTYVKIGQIMSSRVDMLPPSYCQELTVLRQNVKPLDPEIARAVIENETGLKIEDIYSEFKDKPIGSASIAQAHYAVLKDGTRVVTKVQRPLIADMMRKDFVLLKKLASMMGAVSSDDDDSGLDLIAVIDELEKVTEEELDFRIEAENTRYFHDNCLNEDGSIQCPTIINELTTSRILTMTYVDGYSISKTDRLKADGYDVNEIGRIIVENFIHQVLDVGTFHADPHQGNIMVSHGTPYWIDFGMIGHISEESINLLQDIIISLLESDTETLVNAVMSMGAASSKTNRNKLMDDLDAFIERFGSVSNIATLDMGALLADLTDLAAANHIKLPGEYTMLVRALATIEGVLEELCPDLNLFKLVSDKLLERMRKNFDLTQSVLSVGKEFLATGKKVSKIPLLASDALNNLVKGRTKVNMELTGTDEMMNRTATLAKNIILALFACILCLSSSLLCVSDIQPRTLYGIPLIALAGFIVSIALAVYVILKMSKKKK